MNRFLLENIFDESPQYSFKTQILSFFMGQTKDSHCNIKQKKAGLSSIFDSRE